MLICNLPLEVSVSVLVNVSAVVSRQCLEPVLMIICAEVKVCCGYVGVSGLGIATIFHARFSFRWNSIFRQAPLDAFAKVGSD